MERRKTEQLKDVIMRALRQGGLETPLNEHRAMKAWPEVVGPMIARMTTQLQLRDSVMYVKISRPALRQDLSMMHTELTTRINQHVGALVLRDIVVY